MRRIGTYWRERKLSSRKMTQFLLFLRFMEDESSEHNLNNQIFLNFQGHPDLQRFKEKSQNQFKKMKPSVSAPLSLSPVVSSGIIVKLPKVPDKNQQSPLRLSDPMLSTTIIQKEIEELTSVPNYEVLSQINFQRAIDKHEERTPNESPLPQLVIKRSSFKLRRDASPIYKSQKKAKSYAKKHLFFPPRSGGRRVIISVDTMPKVRSKQKLESISHKVKEEKQEKNRSASPPQHIASVQLPQTKQSLKRSHPQFKQFKNRMYGVSMKKLKSSSKFPLIAGGEFVRAQKRLLSQSILAKRNQLFLKVQLSVLQNAQQESVLKKYMPTYGSSEFQSIAGFDSQSNKRVQELRMPSEGRLNIFLPSQKHKPRSHSSLSMSASIKREYLGGVFKSSELSNTRSGQSPYF